MPRYWIVILCVVVMPIAAPAHPLPKGAVARLGNTRFVTLPGNASTLALPPDGKRVAVGGEVTAWPFAEDRVPRHWANDDAKVKSPPRPPKPNATTRFNALPEIRMHHMPS